MVRYSCCFSSGRQFVFAERRSSPVPDGDGFPAVALLGLAFGLLAGITVSLGGALLFEFVFSGLALFVAICGYALCFWRVSSSAVPKAEFRDYASIVGIFATLSVLLLAAVRCSLLLDLRVPGRCALFGTGGSAVCLGAYAYALLGAREDERKHHLGLCGPTGDIISPHMSEVPPVEPACSHMAWLLSRIFTWEWWRDILGCGEPVSEEILHNSCITVHNHTLKLIKVCLYSLEDALCWVPLGGIVSGRCVGFVQAEAHQTFTPPRQEGPNSSCFLIKIFQPGLFDKELARYPAARLGQSFMFADVECMVRRSRCLSSIAAAPQHSLKRGSFTESSDDECLNRAFTGSPTTSSTTVGFELEEPAASEGSATPSSGSGTLRRNAHADDLQAACVRKKARKASPDEIVVRNHSGQVVRLLLFLPNDYVGMVPLASCSDCVLPLRERRFDPRSVDATEFMLRVYSVGPAARELTYLTVLRGGTYTFCDSLLS